MLLFQYIHIGCSVAYNGGLSEPIRMSQTDYDHYREIFIDILVDSQQLRLEPKPIGEGDCYISLIIAIVFKF